MSWWRLAERSGWRLTALVVALQQSTRYRGSLPCRHRRTVTPSLNWMRRGTPSQWILEWSRCVKPRSNFEFHWRPELLHLAHAEDDQWWLLTTRPARHCSNQDGMRRRPLQTQCQANDESFESDEASKRTLNLYAKRACQFRGQMKWWHREDVVAGCDGLVSEL